MIIKIQFLELILLLNNEAAITLTFDIPLQNKILEIRKKRKKIVSECKICMQVLRLYRVHTS